MIMLSYLIFTHTCRKDTFNGDIKRSPATTDNLTDDTARECPERSTEGEEEFAAGRTARAGFPEIAQDSFSDRVREWQ